MTRVIERVRLQYQDRAKNSDKVYEIQLIEEDDGSFRVIGYNGRRGARLTPQPKTPLPVSYRTARDIFDKLQNTKLCHPRTPYRIVDRDIASRTTSDVLEATPTRVRPEGSVISQQEYSMTEAAGGAEITSAVTDTTLESKQPASYEPSYLDALEL
ncbi:MAG: hypothetical protein MSG64_20495 [Pyrinomonadaceae bacterium MAG19_C2-C3]|nr:hypothetical protein [Pyrinomonadaceae bacterium MAG19_C2-C3]